MTGRATADAAGDVTEQMAAFTVLFGAFVLRLALVASVPYGGARSRS
jgi:hypothetical protein